LVEQRIENPRVGGSIPPLGTITFLIKSESYCEVALRRELPIFALGVVLGFSGRYMKFAGNANSDA
jgi:hypothetical protein